MPEPIRVQAPDRPAVTSLLQQLLAFERAVSKRKDGLWEVSVQVPASGADADQVVKSVLGSIESWLIECRLPSARVEVDGESYVLERPRHGGRGSATVGAERFDE